MRIIIISVKNFFIILKKTLKILFILKMLNFFYLFMIFKISFLIIYRSSFTAYSYSKFFILFKSACDSFKKSCNAAYLLFLYYKSSMLFKAVAEQYYYFRIIMQFIKYFICYCFKITA